jgi:thymidylate synthase
VTTKRLAFRAVVAELLWFLAGSSDVNDLHALGVHIWDGTGLGLALQDLGRRELGTEAAEQSARLAEHWDAVASLVGGTRRPRSVRLGALLAELTAALEDGADAVSS